MKMGIIQMIEILVQKNKALSKLISASLTQKYFCILKKHKKINLDRSDLYQKKTKIKVL
jgi:hypothetical protein